jgi:hypothetical protein
VLEESAAGGVGEGTEDVIWVCRLHVKNHNYLVMVLSRGLLHEWCARGGSKTNTYVRAYLLNQSIVRCQARSAAVLL